MARWFAFIALVTACGSTPPRQSGRPAQPEVSQTPRAEPPPRESPLAPPPSSTVGCDERATAGFTIDGLVDDWRGTSVVARAGGSADANAELHCAWDGNALALAVVIDDDRVVRVPRVTGRPHEDHVSFTVLGGGKPLTFDAMPGTAVAQPHYTAPAAVLLADSLQPHGFSVEALVSVTAIPGFSPSTPALEVRAVFHDSDQATGGDEQDIPLVTHIEPGDRRDLLDDFLRDVHLARSDIKLDKLVELDPDRKGKERIVAGGTVIGILTDQYAYATLPVQSAADVRSVELLPLGRGDQQVIAAVVHQSGGGGARDLLLLWTVWSGQLQPLAQIEIRKEAGGNVLACSYKVVRGAKGPELVVTPEPAVGFTAQTWNEEPADDADPILLPWDKARRGIAYSLHGASIDRRDVKR